MSRSIHQRKITPPFALTVRAELASAARHVAPLRRRLRRAHGLLGPKLQTFSVVLVGDKRMAKLHQDFIGIAGPTDVLTFPLDSDKAGDVIEGEVYVCVPEATRRAKEHRTEPADEVLLYALHGMLHLYGYDDRTERAYRKMHLKEDEILIQLGVGPVFAPAVKADRSLASARLTGRRR